MKSETLPVAGALPGPAEASGPGFLLRQPPLSRWGIGIGLPGVKPASGALPLRRQGFFCRNLSGAWREYNCPARCPRRWDVEFHLLPDHSQMDG